LAGFTALLVIAFTAVVAIAHRAPGTVTNASVEQSVGGTLHSASRPTCAGSRSAFRCIVEEPAGGSGGTATYIVDASSRCWNAQRVGTSTWEIAAPELAHGCIRLWDNWRA
jgi:hypothetical protein